MKVTLKKRSDLLTYGDLQPGRLYVVEPSTKETALILVSSKTESRVQFQRFVEGKNDKLWNLESANPEERILGDVRPVENLEVS